MHEMSVEEKVRKFERGVNLRRSLPHRGEGTHGPVFYSDPGNGLPDWVRTVMQTRGLTDSEEALTLIVQEDDVVKAITCAGEGDGDSCVMAQAAKRLGAKNIYFYRSTAYVDFGIGPVRRYAVTSEIKNSVIKPFDANEYGQIEPGSYNLEPPEKWLTMEGKRETAKRRRARDAKVAKEGGPKEPSAASKRKNPVARNMSRVVNASRW